MKVKRCSAQRYVRREMVFFANNDVRKWEVKAVERNFPYSFRVGMKYTYT